MWLVSNICTLEQDSFSCQSLNFSRFRTFKRMNEQGLIETPHPFSMPEHEHPAHKGGRFMNEIRKENLSLAPVPIALWLARRMPTELLYLDLSWAISPQYVLGAMALRSINFLGCKFSTGPQIRLLFPSWKMTKKRLHLCSFFEKEKEKRDGRQAVGFLSVNKERLPPLCNFLSFSPLFLFPIWTETIELNEHVVLWSPCLRIYRTFPLTRNSL